MLTAASAPPGCSHLIANMGALPLIVGQSVLWIFSIPVISLVEGTVIAWLYKWRFKRAFWTAFLLNVLSTVLGVIGALVAFEFFGGRLTGLSLAEAARRWLWLALAEWLTLYVATFLIEAVVLHQCARKHAAQNRFTRALGVSALMNIITYILLGIAWVPSQAPSMVGARLLDKAEWLPNVDEPFVYERLDGALYLATTQGRQLGPLNKMPTEGAAQIRQIIAEQQEPREDAGAKDGTRAYRKLGGFFFSMLVIETGVETTPDAPDDSPQGQQPRDPKTTFQVWGSPGLWQPLFFDSPNVLPGGRTVLFECSGEIMVLDVKERTLVSLFRGRKPIALPSFELEEKNQPPIGTDENQ